MQHYICEIPLHGSMWTWFIHRGTIDPSILRSHHNSVISPLHGEGLHGPQRHLKLIEGKGHVWFGFREALGEGNREPVPRWPQPHPISATLRAEGRSRWGSPRPHLHSQKCGAAQGCMSFLLPGSHPHFQGSLVTPVSLQTKGAA